jgi:hypothetical protein
MVPSEARVLSPLEEVKLEDQADTDEAMRAMVRVVREIATILSSFVLIDFVYGVWKLLCSELYLSLTAVSEPA